jgi:hypothetical protein
MGALPGDGLNRRKPPTPHTGQHLGAASENTYHRGCRCDDCRAAHTAYNKTRHHQRQQQTQEIRNHLQALRRNKGEPT